MTKAPVIDRLILATHGIDGGPGIAARHAHDLRAAGLAGDVLVGCFRGTPRIERMADRKTPIVPLLMARGFIYERLRERLAATGSDRNLRAPLGEHPGLPGFILARAHYLARERGWPAGQCALLLIGHGTTRHAGSDRIVEAHRILFAGAGFRTVETAYLDAPPYLRDIVGRLTSSHCIAIGYFIDDGPHGRDDVIHQLRRLGEGVVYSGAIGSDPGMLDLIADQAVTRPVPPCGSG